MRYLFFLLTLLPTLLSAQTPATNTGVKLFYNDIIIKHNTTGKSAYLYTLLAQQLNTNLGIKPSTIKWGEGEILALKDYIYGKDTLTYEWDYTNSPKDKKLHELKFYGLTLHSSNFSIGDARNNTFFTVGDNAEVFKKWFPKFKITQNFRYLEFTLIGVKDTKTGKWFSEGYLGIGFKQNKNKEWIIANISTEVFEDGTHLVD